MGAMASQITSVPIVCSAVCSGADQRKQQSPASLAFVRGIHRWPMNSPHKGPATRKMFPLMASSCLRKSNLCLSLHAWSVTCGAWLLIHAAGMPFDLHILRWIAHGPLPSIYVMSNGYVGSPGFLRIRELVQITCWTSRMLTYHKIPLFSLIRCCDSWLFLVGFLKCCGGWKWCFLKPVFQNINASFRQDKLRNSANQDMVLTLSSLSGHG